MHWREAGLAQGFQILDSEDQQRLIRKVIKAAELDETRWVPREVQWFINSNKDEGLRPKAPQGRQRPDAAAAHQALRRVRGGVRARRGGGLRGAAAARLRAVARQRRRCSRTTGGASQHVLVDEFQDTNAIQYAWMRLLAPPQRRGGDGRGARAEAQPFVVGDDDQCLRPAPK